MLCCRYDFRVFSVPQRPAAPSRTYLPLQTYVANTPFRLGRTWTGDILQLWIYGQSFNDFVPSPGGACNESEGGPVAA